MNLDASRRGRAVTLILASVAVSFFSSLGTVLLGWAMGGGIALGGALALGNVMVLQWMLRWLFQQQRQAAAFLVLIFTGKLMAQGVVIWAAVVPLQLHGLGILGGYLIVLLSLSVGWAWIVRQDSRGEEEVSSG